MAMTEATTWEWVELDLPLVANGAPLSLNQRHNRFVHNRLTQEIRTAAGWQAKAAKLGHHNHITAQLHYQPGNKSRRRDEDSLVATHKPAVDGLVDAGVIPDDTPDHLTWWTPQIHNEPGTRRLWLAVHITETT